LIKFFARFLIDFNVPAAYYTTLYLGKQGFLNICEYFSGQQLWPAGDLSMVGRFAPRHSSSSFLSKERINFRKTGQTGSIFVINQEN